MNQMSSFQMSFCVKRRQFIQNDFESQKFKPMGSISSFQDGHHSNMYKKFPADSRLCVVTTLEEYLRRTAPLRGNADRLFIRYISPHKSVSIDTIGRWIKTVMALAGIDVSKFKAHSTRMASSSKT